MSITWYKVVTYVGRFHAHIYMHIPSVKLGPPKSKSVVYKTNMRTHPTIFYKHCIIIPKILITVSIGSNSIFVMFSGNDKRIKSSPLLTVLMVKVWFGLAEVNTMGTLGSVFTKVKSRSRTVNNNLLTWGHRGKNTTYVPAVLFDSITENWTITSPHISPDLQPNVMSTSLPSVTLYSGQKNPITPEKKWVKSESEKYD